MRGHGCLQRAVLGVRSRGRYPLPAEIRPGQVCCGVAGRVALPLPVARVPLPHRSRTPVELVTLALPGVAAAGAVAAGASRRGCRRPWRPCGPTPSRLTLTLGHSERAGLSGDRVGGRAVVLLGHAARASRPAMVSQCAARAGAHEHREHVGQHVTDCRSMLLPGRLAGQGAEPFAVLRGRRSGSCPRRCASARNVRTVGVASVCAVQVADAPVLVPDRQRGGVEPFGVGVAAQHGLGHDPVAALEREPDGVVVAVPVEQPAHVTRTDTGRLLRAGHDASPRPTGRPPGSATAWPRSPC